MPSSPVWFYALFFGSLALGYALRRGQTASPSLMRFAILFLDAPIFAYTFWRLDLVQARHFAAIPAASILLVLFPLFLSAIWARRLLAAPASRGGFVLTAAFSNIGTTGGAFLCYLAFGFNGLALAYLYLLPYPILVFTLGFALAKHHGTGRHPGLGGQLRNLLSNPLSLIPLLAIALGFGLNLLAGPPPAWLAFPADALIKLDLGVMCLAIGMTLDLANFFPPWRVLTALGAIKFIASPLLAWAGVEWYYGSLEPLAARVILIESCMPPAIYAVVTANLFGLDRKLVNALWVSLSLVLLPLAAMLLFRR